MPQSYTPEFKKKIVRLHEEEGRTYKSITAEYGVSKASISKWCSEFSKECQTKALENPDIPNEMELMKENLRLRKELEEAKKENPLLKKSSGILCKGNRLEAYRFIEQYHELFGLRWLLRRLEICPNAYYNYRKHRKADYYANKAEVHAQIQEIYHIHNGVDGYRSMKVYLERRGYSYSTATVHKYMNTELGLHSIVRPKKPEYEHGKPHKIFDNKLNQDFTADEINRKWCTDFTYLFLSNHEVRYNCTILDLHDRSVVASITDRRITSNLAIRTLQKALESQPPIKGGLILHSDQGSQFTSKAFVEFCESVNVTQSMSKAGYPYDNAPMERYFNTLKNECTNLYEFETEKALYQKVEEFAYVDYNHVRPHSFNDYRTPYEARMAA
ncbi:MAG: IS3 family transposase [Clostridium sp.]|uniref:IS3 family transposase n=1 Tax=Alitiscatomonas aceti TaxID=2981724 RepID=A0ABT2V3M2_9FIRM|nr:IS3 family transposase [Alitiscatomonas aceti]MCU6801494.1 IS3 family transposase [Alitiscatomonas aceti]MED9825996.1 IS3 family transposase [Blautia faecis]